MIRSMTGYGRAVQILNGREISVELHAVNNRYLDCNVKMPRQLAFAEEAIKQEVRQAVARGKVEVLVTVTNLSAEEARVSLNRPVLESYLAAMRAMVQDYGLQDDLTASTLCRFSDIFVVEKAKTDEESEKQDLLTVAREAIAAFNAMRQTEGAALEQDLRRRTQTILHLVEQVERQSPVTLAAYRARLEAKMREVLENTSLDETRILMEAALYADKIAVDEETVRLRSHLSQMDSMLTGGGPVGRKLDFLLQEMNREANTIGSKANDTEQARTVVEIKAELEKIREQIQNVE